MRVRGSVLPLGELVDIQKELERLAGEQKKLESEIARAEGKLKNENFTKKAPAAVVEEERGKLKKYQGMLEAVEKRIESFKALK